MYIYIIYIYNVILNLFYCAACFAAQKASPTLLKAVELARRFYNLQDEEDEANSSPLFNFLRYMITKIADEQQKMLNN